MWVPRCPTAAYDEFRRATSRTLSTSTSRSRPGPIEAIDLIEEIGIELGHTFLQKPGMLTFLNNHSVYHGRTAWRRATRGLSTASLTAACCCALDLFASHELPGDGPHGALTNYVGRHGVRRCARWPGAGDEAGLKTKPKELVEAYRSGRAQYYGMYKRSYEGEDVRFDKVAKVESDSSPSASGSASPTSDK